MAWEMTKKAIMVHMAFLKLERAKKNSWRMRVGVPARTPLYYRVYKGWNAGVAYVKSAFDCSCCEFSTEFDPAGHMFEKAKDELKEKLASGEELNLKNLTSSNKKKKKRKKKKKKKKKKTRSLWQTRGTWHHQILTYLIGFIAGTLSTVVMYFFMVYQLNYNPFTATVFTLGLGPFLSVGLAFSEEMRLMAILMFPYLFAGRGRAMLLSFCLVLAINGPGKSIVFNIEILNDSLSCYYNILLDTICTVVQHGLSGILSVVQTVVDIANKMFSMYRRIMAMFRKIKNIMMEIGEMIQSAFNWLRSIKDVCDDKYGGPFERCEKTFNDAINNCMTQLGLGALNYHLCRIVDWFKSLCIFARVIEYLCQPARGAKRGSVDEARSYIYQASDKYHSFFLFGLELYSDFDMKVSMSKSFKQIRKDIVNEVIDRGGWVFFIMDAFSWSCVLYLLMVAAKAVKYRYRYVTDEGYDNSYMSIMIRRIDNKREAIEKPTLLPLKLRERRKYIEPLSLNMTYAEIRELTRIAINLLATGFQVGYLIFVDTALYFIMETIRENGYVRTNFKGSPPARTAIEGRGIVADSIRSSFQDIPSAFASAVPDVDTSKCVPYAWPPNYARYRQIGVFYIMVLVFGLMQPFMLRLRHMACNWYYPEMSRKRALWLYNTILKRRGGFITAVKRLLRRKKMVDPNMRLVSKIIDQLGANVPCVRVILNYMGMRRVYCGVCTETFDPQKDSGSFRRCDNYGCDGVYCFECFRDMNNRCTLCLKPVEYGDISDISEEVDSSSDEEIINRREERKLMKELGLPRQEEDEAEDEYLEFDYQQDAGQADNWQEEYEQWQQKRDSSRDVEALNIDHGATYDMTQTDEGEFTDSADSYSDIELDPLIPEQ